MTRDDLAETALGFAVVAAAAAFFLFAAQHRGPDIGQAYPLHAAFSKVDGVAPGTEVRLSGVKVGAVNGVRLLPERNYWARVDFSVRSDVKIPADSTVRIASDGLLGGAHVAIEPGGSDQMLAAGGEFTSTEGAIDVFSILAAFAEQGSSAPQEQGTPQ